MNDQLTSNLISFALGFAASLLSWWYVSKWMVPKIEFSKCISSEPNPRQAGTRNRIKFLNAGNRAVIDVHAVTRLAIDWDGDDIWSAYYIPLSPTGEKRYEMPKIISAAPRILTFYPMLALGLIQSPFFPTELQQNVQEGNLTLIDLLNLGVSAELRVYVFGYDEFSGARKLYESGPYARTSILEGQFNGLIVEPTEIPIYEPRPQNAA